MEELTLVSTIAVLAAILVTGVTLYTLSQPETKSNHPHKDKNNNMSKRQKSRHSVEEQENDDESSNIMKSAHYRLPSPTTSTPTANSKSDHKTYKGYTTDSKGNIRTYFHREVTPEDRVLIGDCTPKLLSRTSTSETPSRSSNSSGHGHGHGHGPSGNTKNHHSTHGLLYSSSSSSSSSSNQSYVSTPVVVARHTSTNRGGAQEQGQAQEQGSLWNSAGTWEERDYSKWGKNRLKSLLDHIVVYLPDKQGQVNVTDVSHIEGDASMVHIRGRNKLIYDFSLHVHWKATLRGGSEKTVLEGKFLVSEITGDCMYDIKSQIPHYNVRMSEKYRYLLDQYILSSNQGVRKEITESLHQFLRDFQSLHKQINN